MLVANTTAKVCYVIGLTIFLTALGGWAGLAHQDSSTASSVAKGVGADEAFAGETELGSMAEIKLGQLAQDRSANQTVKNFGAEMATEYTNAGDQLKELAAREHIKLPPDLAARDQATYDKLAKLSGEAFDRAYAEDMLRDHKRDLRAFQRETNYGKDDLIKGFASQTIPMIQRHLSEAKEMLKDVSATSSRRTSAPTGGKARGR